MPDRFYVPTPLDQQSVRLTGPEAHHLRDVLRLKVGAEVVLFDGEGVEATAEIIEVKKAQVEFRVLQMRRDGNDPKSRIVLATAAPKGERFRWLVEKAAELGVDRLVPLITERSVVDPRETRLEKMRAVVIAACKQSRRNRLMQIDAPVAWTDFVDGRRANAVTRAQWLVADTSGGSIAALRSIPQPLEFFLTVGPEGGLTAAELDHAVAAGAQLVALGPQILRVETAAIALVSFVALSEFESDRGLQ
jgi:16S rRNA (uracil1498-N3)-methyltransferase